MTILHLSIDDLINYKCSRQPPGTQFPYPDPQVYKRAFIKPSLYYNSIPPTLLPQQHTNRSLKVHYTLKMIDVYFQDRVSRVLGCPWTCFTSKEDSVDQSRGSVKAGKVLDQLSSGHSYSPSPVNNKQNTSVLMSSHSRSIDMFWFSPSFMNYTKSSSDILCFPALFSKDNNCGA